MRYDILSPKLENQYVFEFLDLIQIECKHAKKAVRELKKKTTSYIYFDKKFKSISYSKENRRFEYKSELFGSTEDNDRTMNKFFADLRQLVLENNIPVPANKVVLVKFKDYTMSFKTDSNTEITLMEIR